MNEHNLSLNTRPFEAIKNFTKKIEIRANKERIRLINVGDKIIFTNSQSNEKMQCIVSRIVIYPTVRSLLEKEGTQYTLSSTNNIDEGIKSIESIADYKEIIAKMGVCAIELKEPRIIS